MDILQELVSRVLPLYGFIIVGFGCNKLFGLKSRFISKVLLYALIPVLIIDNLLKAELSELLVVSGSVFILAALMNIPALLTTRFLVKDFNSNLMKGSFSYYNIGWFGIPVVMALFGEEQMAFIVSAYVGNALYGDTIGYYLVSRTKDLPVKKAIKNVFKIPAIYACIIALVLNLLSVEVPEWFEPGSKGVSWAVSVLGMLIIGVTLGKVKFKHIDYGMFSKILGVRYLSGILFLVLLVFIESQLLGILEDEQQKLMLLLATFPIAANLVVFSSFLATEEKNTALLVGASSIISLILVPIACFILF